MVVGALVAPCVTGPGGFAMWETYMDPPKSCLWRYELV
jgi:hypothetical protein